MDTQAIVITRPGELALREVTLAAPGPADVVVDIAFSGISTGTEKLLWTGRMPDFPGMGYPLVPGYESVGTVVEAGPDSGRRAGETVFVPGANCYAEARGLFGGAAARVVVPGAKVVAIDPAMGAEGTLMALAATARHAIARGARTPDLVIGHGVLGRLVARIAAATGPAPTVWEVDPARADGGMAYEVVHPDADPRRDYAAICDVSGDASLIDTLVGRLAKGGEIVLAGFYAERVGFSFPPAFIKEARLSVAAEWAAEDLSAVRGLIADGALSLGGLITHHRPATGAAEAYPMAFDDPGCLKMILDWRH